MLKIFDKNHNAIGHIVKYKDCKIESELSNGDKTLSFTYLAKHYSLENEMYVRTIDDEYVIKEVPATTGNFPQIVAVLNLEDLQKDMWEKVSVTDSMIDEAVRPLLAGTGWIIGECDVVKQRNAGMMQVSTLEAIQKLCTAFMCEPVFDTINKKVSFYNKRGEDKGAYFISGLNLKKLQKKVTSYGYYTRIIPVGANGLSIESVNDGKNYLENYQYSNKVLTYIWKDESYTDPQALKEDAELKLNDLSKPEKAYSADIYNLAKQKPGYAALSYGLGDTIILIDRETGTREKQRIVKMVEYPQDHSKDTCEIANTLLTFEEMQQKVQSAAEIINYTITGDGRYTGTINVSDILYFEQGVAGSQTVAGINGNISTMQGDLGAIKIKVGEVEVNYLKVDDAELKYATIENLNVMDQTVHSIQGDYAEFKTVTSREVSAQKGIINNLSGQFSSFKTSVSQELIAAKGWMAEGAIGDAQISSVSANKLKAGTIDTAIVTVAGSDGRLQISDNTMQISDGDRVRVQAGKDASGDYTLAVWDASGKLIWDALGATENTIQRKIIRDKMVADDAAIQALKLDLRSFNTALTKQGVAISGTVVQVGNKTLNVALTEQTQLITDHGGTLTDHAAKITANENAIKFKVSTQDYEAYKATVNGEISSARSRLDTAESSITVLKGQISLKVEQTDIDTAVNNISIGGRNLIKKTAYAYRNNGGLILSYGSDGYLTASGTTTVAGNITIARLTDVTGLSGKYTFSAKRDSGTDTAFTLTLYQGGTYKKTHTLAAGKDSVSFDATGYDFGYISIVNTVSGRKVGLKARFKLEKGTKATDWTPAPEDLESSIDALDAKFVNYSTTSQMTAAITAAKDSITQSVSATYATKASVDTVSGKVTNLTSRVQTAESKLTKDSLVTTIGSYYATKASVDDLEIGGRNLIPNTRDMAGYSKSSNVTLAEDAEGITAASFAAVSTLAWNKVESRKPIRFSAVRGKKVTYSIWVRSDDYSALNADNSHGLMLTISLCTGTSTARTLYGGKAFYTTALSSDWKKTTWTATLTDSFFSSGTGTIDDNTRLYVQVYNYSLYRMQVKKIKLEYGDKATDWSPAPEDDLEYIASVQTIATQTADKFNWLVKSGTSATDFTLTDRTATLVANAINLKGLVTFSGLDSAAQSKINTAQSTADTAKSNAAAAQSAVSAVDSVIAAWCYSNNRTYINGSKIYTGTITAEKIAAGAIVADKIAANAVTAAKLATDAVKSRNYAYSSGIYSTTGTFLDLSNGVIRSKNFGIDASGNAYFKGNLAGATGNFSGSIDATSITASKLYSIYSGQYSLKIISYDPDVNSLVVGMLNNNAEFDSETTSGFKFMPGYIWVHGNIGVGEAAADWVTTDRFDVYGEATFLGTTKVYDNFSFMDYAGNMRRPLGATSTDGSRAAYLTANLSNGIKVNGQWNVAGAAFTSKTFTASSSDIRLKENIRPTEVEALPLLNQIGIYQFDWKRDGSHQKIGFIADYLEQQDSNLSIGGGYDEYGMMDEKVVNDFYLLGYVVKGIQEICAWTANYAAKTDRILTTLKAELDYTRNTAISNQQRLAFLEAQTQADNQSTQAQLASMQAQLQQALNRIAEQDALIRQLQAAG